MVEINPLALINNPRFTPKIQDHSAIQKLLTDSHIQQSKNKAAAARNLLSEQVGFAKNLVTRDLPPGSAILDTLKMNLPGLAPALTKTRGLKDTKIDAEALQAASSAMKSQSDAGFRPTQLSGTAPQIARRPGILGAPPVKTVRNINEEVKIQDYLPPSPSSLGSQKRTRTSGVKTKAAPTTGSSLSELASVGNWSALSNQITKTANYLKMSPKDLLAKIQLGLRNNDGSIIIEKHHIIIDGQRIQWTR